jgi:hypothetical protein
VEHGLRAKLIESLKARSWSDHDAERVATRVDAVYDRGSGEWKVLLWGVAGGEQDLYLVTRQVNGRSVFDSPLQILARDVAAALNEIEAGA